MIDRTLDACASFIRTDRPPVDATGDTFADILLAAVFVHMAREETLSARLATVLRYDVDTAPPAARRIVRKWADELHDAATMPRSVPQLPSPADDYGRQRAAATSHSTAARPIPIVTVEQYREMTKREAEEFESDRRASEYLPNPFSRRQGQ